MKQIIATLVFAFTANFAAANPMVNALKAEDESRLCPASEVSKETRLLRREAAYVLETMGMPKDSITVLVAKCGDYAVAATSLNTIVISPSLAELPRAERLFILAHEVGHLANGDVKRLLALGEELSVSAEALANVDKLMANLSRENETAADAFAAKFMHKVDLNAENAASAFFARMGLLQLPGTASHPAAQSRVAAIALASTN
jgi:Zn-dependent protease with chaperone function